ncbi:AEC family transporter [Phyllobacterium salinisoli]|uniref:AEC family transporter n=1 Tax=Phyllobacterium salinisoli TaxID=1899321 RepID=A0A368K9R7_9HYPH|nr:AEC family transporter [Phyllobacterium salinisoli]RCS25355.1 AEC family transporter [Phyllobacterium salinisoli]
MGLAGTIFIIFSIIFIGYAAASLRVLGEATGDGLSDFVFVVATPLLLFRTMISADFHGSAPWALWVAYFSGVVGAWLVSHGAIRTVFGRDRRAGVVAGVSGAFSNLVFLGMPLMLGVFGHEGVAIISLIISVHMPSMMATSIALNEWATRRDGIGHGETHLTATIKSFFRSLLRNPLVIGILSGWAWRFSGLEMPQFASTLIDTLAGVAGPVALFAMGMGLKKFGISGNVRAAFLTATIKLMLMPAVVLAVAWALQLPPLTAKVAVTAAALPSGINSYLIATRFGTGQALASTSMVIATGISALTLGLWISIATHVFG